MTPKVPADVFVIPVGADCLLHAPLRGVSAVLNRSALASLRSGFSHITDNCSALGHLRRDLAVEPSIPAPRTGPLDPAFLGIIPTRSCNASCVYCGFRAGTEPDAFIDIRLAAAAVDWMAETVASRGREVLEVHFFGGEPFLATEVIDAVVHRTRERASFHGLVPHLEASTNGLFSEETARFVGDYFSAVVLSLDGFPALHDRQRPFANGKGSFERAARTAKLLSQSETKLCLRACINDQTVGLMRDIVDFFSVEFQPSVIDFEVVRRPGNLPSQPLASPDPYEFAVNFVSAECVAERRGVDLVYSAASKRNAGYKACPVGNDVVIASPDGTLSACYLIEDDWRARKLDLNLGRVGPVGVEIDASAVGRIRALTDGNNPRCRKCFCRWGCFGGCLVDVTFPGCALAYDSFCIQTRIITAAQLLVQLGERERLSSLMGSRRKLEELALNSSDRLEDWGLG